MKYLLLIILLVAVVITAGCVGGNPSYYEITNVKVTPQVLPEPYRSIAPGFTEVSLTIKNTASEAKSFVRVEANIYDNNDVFVCHGFDVGTTLQPRQNSNFFILCQGAYAADKSLKEPEIKILEKYT
jgi:hypothetical protein